MMLILSQENMREVMAQARNCHLYWNERFIYEATIDYMKSLNGLEIDYKVYIVGGVGHNPDALYQEIGGELMDFHSDAFTIQK